MIKTDDLYDTYGGVHSDPTFYQDCCAPQDDECPIRTLTLNYTEETGGETMTFGLTLEDDKTEYLPTVMAAFEKVLHAMGFDYVRLVKASESGHGLYTYN